MALLKSTGSKKVNLDFNKEFINTFSNNIENRNIDFINQTFKDQIGRAHVRTPVTRGSRMPSSA